MRPSRVVDDAERTNFVDSTWQFHRLTLSTVVHRIILKMSRFLCESLPLEWAAKASQHQCSPMRLADFLFRIMIFVTEQLIKQVIVILIGKLATCQIFNCIPLIDWLTTIQARIAIRTCDHKSYLPHKGRCVLDIGVIYGVGGVPIPPLFELGWKGEEFAVICCREAICGN